MEMGRRRRGLTRVGFLRCAVLVSGWLAGVAGTAAAKATNPDAAGIARAFRRMKVGVRQENELQFKSGWVPAGYDDNLVGGRGGMAGNAFFRQGVRNSWLLQPRLDRMQRLPGRREGPWIVSCLVWSAKLRKPVATVYALMVHSAKVHRWQMLGGGGRRDDVVALGERYVKGQPLQPRTGR